MLVFNCTKAAADFFTVTRKGEKTSCIEPAPHKSIQQSVENPIFPDDVSPEESGGFQWQWLLHCISVKRKKYLLVMDYHSRYCIVIPAGKKGDQFEFLNNFELYLKANFQCLALEAGIDPVEILSNIDAYDRRINTCAFHLRGDRSVQAHLNDAAWHVERHCYEDFMLESETDCLSISLSTAKMPRRTKGSKDFFFPNQALLIYWQDNFSCEREIAPHHIIDVQKYIKKLH